MEAKLKVFFSYMPGWLRLIILAPIFIAAMLISNRVDGAPDHVGQDNRAFKWLPWGRKAKF